MFEIYNGNGITANDILTLANYIISNRISKELPIKICKLQEDNFTHAKDIKVNKEDILILD